MSEATSKENRRGSRNLRESRLWGGVASENFDIAIRLTKWAIREAITIPISVDLPWVPKIIRHLIVGLYVSIAVCILLVPALFLAWLLSLSGGMQYLYSILMNPDRQAATNPSELIKNAKVGQKVSAGGKRGGKSGLRVNAIADRDEEIREEGRKLLTSGVEKRELATELQRIFSEDEGWPKSRRSYSNIIKPILDEEKKQ